MSKVRCFPKKYSLVFCFLWPLLGLYLYIQDGDLTLVNRRIPSVERQVTSTRSIDSTSDPKRPRQECIQPQLKFDDPIMIKLLKKLSPPICKDEDWVYVHNGTVRFSPHAVKAYSNITCNYSALQRDGDDKVKWESPILNIPDGFNMTSDFFRVVCTAAENKSYNGIHAGVAYTNMRAQRKEDPLKTGLEGLSIAILGFDSMSRMSWLRRLLKTREYFHEQLGAIELEAHNILGDGTTAAMFPMLTGKFEWELPECRRKFKGATPLDKFPFVWHKMKEAGYLTSWCNAKPWAAPFNWRMLGFKEQPTDFYTRPFYLLATSLAFKDCMGSRTFSRVWLNYFRDIFFMYKHQRKFLFHFFTDFSHDDNNLITSMDEDIKNVLQLLYEGNYLDDTLLILMGDHGARYNLVRSSLSGKLEERLPYFALLFPSWFEKKYPQAIKNLRTNTKRLTTPFDVHETFLDFLQFRETGMGNTSQRGISLFKEIPLERSCEDAGIAPHWCACLTWSNVSLDDAGVKGALQLALSTINGFTEEYRDNCALLSLANVTMTTKLVTRAEVLKFKNTDQDGGIYRVNLTDKKTNEVTLYQLTFYTKPGGGHFEVTVTYENSGQKFSLSEKEISRINKYGNDPACILDKNRQIRQYCYCQNRR